MILGQACSCSTKITLGGHHIKKWQGMSDLMKVKKFKRLLFSLVLSMLLSFSGTYSGTCTKTKKPLTIDNQLLKA